jgi:hypothetical protein
VKYDFGGGVFWFAAKPKRGARLVVQSTLVEGRMPATAPARDSSHASMAPDTAPAFGAYHNTDAWLPFFNYDSGNGFAHLTVTVRIPPAYRLTTSVPQTETVKDGVRTVVARSGHPQFLLALAYDRDWRVESSMIETPIGPVRVETFLTPDFRFTHDSLAKVAARVRGARPAVRRAAGTHPLCGDGCEPRARSWRVLRPDEQPRRWRVGRYPAR